MENGLRLLMRDGAIHVAFHPRLTAEQYGELMGVVAAATTKAELQAALSELAKKWNADVQFED